MQELCNRYSKVSLIKHIGSCFPIHMLINLKKYSDSDGEHFSVWQLLCNFQSRNGQLLG